MTMHSKIQKISIHASLTIVVFAFHSLYSQTEVCELHNRSWFLASQEQVFRLDTQDGAYVQYSRMSNSSTLMSRWMIPLSWQ